VLVREGRDTHVSAQMSFRAAPPDHPIRITLDGKVLAAEDGEPAAAALVGAGKLAIARSTKFHRPRGPSCMRGACDGCLARVDDEPNVMTCMVAAHEGMTIDTQNILGSRGIDLLRVTDWFFPEGLNHHELFAGVPGAQGVMQAFARRVAGLGRLPGSELPARRAPRRQLDVLVVGGGPSGMAVAGALSDRGRSVEVVDDALRAGGGLSALAGERRAWGEIEARFHAGVSGGRIALRTSTVAGGVYGDDVLVVGDAGAEVCMAKDLVLATGAHDGVGLFEGNDVPGVMSARAAGMLLQCGVVVGKRVVVAGEGTAGFGDAFARAAGEAKLCEVVRVKEVLRVRGSSKVRAVVVREGGREREIPADALLVDAPSAPAYELCAQAGARLEHQPRGFVVRTEGGRIRDHVWAVGEVVGTELAPRAMLEEASRVAEAISKAQSSISTPKSPSPPAIATASNVASKTR
jgi:sarcosine oxidase, subunit alpha